MSSKSKEFEYLMNWMPTNQWLRGDEEDRYSLIGNMRVKYTHEELYSQVAYLVIPPFL